MNEDNNTSTRRATFITSIVLVVGLTTVLPGKFFSESSLQQFVVFVGHRGCAATKQAAVHRAACAICRRFRGSSARLRVRARDHRARITQFGGALQAS